MRMRDAVCSSKQFDCSPSHRTRMRSLAEVDSEVRSCRQYYNWLKSNDGMAGDFGWQLSKCQQTWSFWWWGRAFSKLRWVSLFLNKQNMKTTTNRKNEIVFSFSHSVMSVDLTASSRRETNILVKPENWGKYKKSVKKTSDLKFLSVLWNVMIKVVKQAAGHVIQTFWSMFSIYSLVSSFYCVCFALLVYFEGWILFTSL